MLILILRYALLEYPDIHRSYVHCIAYIYALNISSPKPIQQGLSGILTTEVA